MPRYFYTDALAALWMMKHFGMKLREQTSEPGRYIDIPKYDPWNIPILGGNYDCEVVDIGRDTRHEQRRYDVHPDSLHLLEPLPGDLVKAGEFCAYIVDRKGDDIKLSHNPRPGEPLAPFSITQRNGKAFHWPESAEA